MRWMHISRYIWEYIDGWSFEGIENRFFSSVQYVKIDIIKCLIIFAKSITLYTKMSALAEYDDAMADFTISNGKIMLSNSGRLSAMLGTLKDQLLTCTEFTEARQLLFVTVITQKKVSSITILEMIEHFPELASTFMTKDELIKLFSDFELSGLKELSEENEIIQEFKPDAKVYLLHLHLTFNKNATLDSVTKLYHEDINEKESLFMCEEYPSNSLEMYSMGCKIHSCLITRCNNEIFRFLMKRNDITDLSKCLYVTIEDVEPDIIRDLIGDDDTKNKIICDEQGWTLLHAFIWNSTWTGSKESQNEKRFECYKALVTAENILIKDAEDRTPRTLYEYIFFENERDSRIVEMFS